MGLFDFLKKGKEEPAKPQAKPQAKAEPKTQPISKGTDVTSRAPGHPEHAFYTETDKSKVTDTSANQDVYTVQSGDSLSKIAKKLYGDANAWHKLYDANKDKIGDNPDLIRPGQRFVVPRENKKI